MGKSYWCVSFLLGIVCSGLNLFFVGIFFQAQFVVFVMDPLEIL